MLKFKWTLKNSKVHFSGHVDDEAKVSVFLNTDICIVSSFAENFCIVVAESLAFGVPIIVSSGLPQWQDVEKYGCGLWVKNYPQTLAQAILTMRKFDLSGMGNKGRQWMKEKFSWGGQ